MDPAGTVVVLTALDIEYDAVRALVRNPQEYRHPAGTLFERCELPGASGTVVLAETGQGNPTAALIAERAIAEFAPVAVLFVGIAGALHDDLELGTVVVATKVYGYHGGTDETAGFRARPQAWDADHSLEQAARGVARTRTWTEDLPAGTDPPRVVLRPVAAGAVVLNSRDTALAEQLHGTYGDAAAIEMESAGTARAAQHNRARFIAIRGISDKADGNKHRTDRAGAQGAAAANAAAFAMALVRSVLSADNAAPTARSSRQGAEQPPSGEVAAPVWVELPQPASVTWRTELADRWRSMERPALEVHLVPVGAPGRIEVRRLRRLKDELLDLGRSRRLFSATERLRAGDTDVLALAASTEYQTGPRGIAVLRSGQRSVWTPLPADDMGAVLDPDDLVGRVASLVELLTALDLPAPESVAVAIGVEPCLRVTEDRVARFPRTQASGPRLIQHVRVPPDDAVPYRALLDDPTAIAEELAARLMAVFRRSR